MAAVGSHDETRPKDTFLAPRVRGPHSDDAISLSHDRDDTRSVKDFDTCRGCRVLQEPVKPLSTGTVLSSPFGKPVVDDGIVFPQSYDMHRRRDGTNGVADTHVVEHIEAGWMNGVSRQNLVAWKPLPIQQQH